MSGTVRIIVECHDDDPTTIDPHEVAEMLTNYLVGERFPMSDREFTITRAEWEMTR
jgi:hypothetical protein